MVEHSGSTGGYRTDITRFPGAHTSVVTMCNVSTADPVTLAHRVADVVLAARFTKPVPTAPVRAAAQQGAPTIALSADALSAMSGRYYSDELSATFDLSPVAGGLLLRRAHAGPDTLRATDAHTLRGGGVTLHFDANGSGPAKAFTVENGRARGLEFARVASNRRQVSRTRPDVGTPRRTRPASRQRFV